MTRRQSHDVCLLNFGSGGRVLVCNDHELTPPPPKKKNVLNLRLFQQSLPRLQPNFIVALVVSTKHAQFTLHVITHVQRISEQGCWMKQFRLQTIRQYTVQDFHIKHTLLHTSLLLEKYNNLIIKNIFLIVLTFSFNIPLQISTIPVGS